MDYKIIEKYNRKYFVHLNQGNVDNYMIDMIVHNKLTNFLKIIKGKEYMYDITEYISLKEYSLKNGIYKDNLDFFIKSLISLQIESKEYLLEMDYINCKEECIFVNEKFDKVKFVFKSAKDNEFKIQVTNLLKYIIGNYYIYDSIKEERLREDLINTLQKERYDFNELLVDFENLESNPNFSQSPVKKKLKISMPRFNKMKKGYNDNTFEIESIKGEHCLISITDITKKIYINELGITIGRSFLQKGYNISNKGIGRMHSRVKIENNKILLTDMGSKNGSFINGKEIDKRVPYEIEKGDIVAFADEEFMVK